VSSGSAWLGVWQLVVVTMHQELDFSLSEGIMKHGNGDSCFGMLGRFFPPMVVMINLTIVVHRLAVQHTYMLLQLQL